MDFGKLDMDVNLILNKHFTKGRGAKKVDFIGIHYNAGNLTVEGCYNVWQNREASAHIQVESSGRSGQLVWDRDTAWALSNFGKNQESINIEHANMADGTITEQALDVGAHIVAAYCKEYGLGRPEWGVNVIPHKAISPTSCPGQIYGSQKDAYISRAQYWYDVMTGTIKPENTEPETPLPDVLKRFVDLDPDAWYIGAVEECVREGYMNGCAADRFAPVAGLTRGQAVVVMANVSREPLDDYLEPFDDVDPNPFYYTALCWAVDNQVVSEQTNFRPDDITTRAEFVCMLYNYNNMSAEPEQGGEHTEFEDWQDVPDFAKAPMAWAIENGIISGSDKRLRPNAGCTRAEAAAMVSNML